MKLILSHFVKCFKFMLRNSLVRTVLDENNDLVDVVIERAVN